MKNASVPFIPTLTINEFANELTRLYKRGTETKFLNVFLHGKPGIGKSEVIKYVAEHILKINFINIRLGQKPPMDFQGNPINKTLSDGEIRQSYSTPSCLPSVSIHGEKGILLLDEFNMSNNAIMGMAQQLLDSRRIGDTVLPKGWMIISCNNLRSHGAHVNEISMPNRSRAIHFNITEDLDQWITNYALPAGIHPLIISYLKAFPSHFYNLPNPNEYAYACPRTWSYASELLYCGMERFLAAAIGEGIAVNFNTYYQLKDDLPNWDRIKDPKYVWKGKSNLSAAYAATITAITKANMDNFRDLLKFIFNNLGEEYTAIFTTSVYDTVRIRGVQNPEVMDFLDYIVESKLPGNIGDVFDQRLKSIKEANEIGSLFN